jgi:alkylhydroperoxidase family enzyme
MTFLAEPPASPGATAEYSADLDSDGYVNNLTRVWAWRPDVLAAYRATTGALTGDTTLSAREIALLVTATAAARHDAYCGLAWGRRLARAASPSVAAGVLAGSPQGLTARETALVAWCRSVAGDPNGTTDGDVTGLREAGLTDREIFEATTYIALRMAFSTVNAALGAAPDPQLADSVPAEVRTAVTYGRPPA